MFWPMRTDGETEQKPENVEQTTKKWYKTEGIFNEAVWQKKGKTIFTTQHKNGFCWMITLQAFIHDTHKHASGQSYSRIHWQYSL